jgi:hypothetical protein
MFEIKIYNAMQIAIIYYESFVINCSNISRYRFLFKSYTVVNMSFFRAVHDKILICHSN